MARHRRPGRQRQSAGMLMCASVLGGVAKAVAQWMLTRLSGDGP